MTIAPANNLTNAHLMAAPFHLDAEAVVWVRRTHAGMETEAKLAQIVIPACRDLSEDALDALAARGLGGMHRFPSYAEADLRRSARHLFAQCAIPPLLTGDIEMSEKASVKAGTPFPNQMAVAATGETQNAWRMGALAAREAGFLGFGISWTPVADLALNFRSNVVNTRAFSAGVQQTLDYVTAYIEGMHDNGMVACVKHFPGDGLDERDQHFVTTHNSMQMPEWRASFGRIYEAAIARDARLIMAGHITLAAYAAERGEVELAGPEQPASLNADLLQGLLRGELGFNGVIVSDATGMVGFTARGARADLVPRCIESGCDLLLFPQDIEEDIGFLRAGLETGALSQQRLDEAVLRVLALKASMGLHRGGDPLPSEAARGLMLGTEEHGEWSRGVSEQALTLVKDRQNLLPLSPERHRRILLAELPERTSPSAPMPALQIARKLEDRGFIVTRAVPGEPLNPEGQDVGLYLMADEGLSGKEVLGPHWQKLHGRFPLTMQRMWHHLPTLYVSLGSPFLLFHMPECPTYINAYSAVLPVQEALVEALTGRIPFRGQSPIDASCGLPFGI